VFESLQSFLGTNQLLSGGVALAAGASSSSDPETYFEDEWVRSLFALALEDLRAACASSGRSVRFELFRRYDLHDDSVEPRPTYERLARELSLATSDVTNDLAAARREFRSIVLERLREICADEEEFRAEAASLLGAAEAAPR